MDNKKFMTIDGIPVEIENEKNLLELIRKAGIKLPTFCYHSELSIYGACRMCMVENEWGGLDAACSAQPRPGGKIRTNTQRLRKYRKMILELLLANHCRDCTTCQNNGSCKLQDLAARFNIEGVRFPNGNAQTPADTSSPCISKDMNKCILCGDCVRMCNEVQNVGAIDFAHRGSKMAIATAFDEPLADSPCVGCGQCAAICPTGAIVAKNDTCGVMEALDDKDTKVTVQIAPAVRVALGKSLGAKDGDNNMGYIVAALRRMGFDEIFDTSLGADLTVLEESNELLGRLEKNEAFPLFSSCCPAWINYCEKKYPELMPHVSSCKSPMQMFAAIIKEQYKTSSRNVVHVAIMPCTAKKHEARREEFKTDGIPDVDFVITTQELIQMIKESGIVFGELQPEAVDMPFGTATGAGVIFGTSGGVTEAVLRRIISDKSKGMLKMIEFQGVRGAEGIKEASFTIGGRTIRAAMVSGLANASKLIDQLKSGEAEYDFVEVMACPGGCVSGAGQPYVPQEQKTQRADGLYAADRMSNIKRSEENPLVMSLYNGILKGRVHDMLHVSYQREV
ncbi:MAG: [FeFe] hydrogenase, group A [Christensenellaceae bacterium]|jgi:NADH-quinone oxidoreductase subunit G